MDGQDARRDRGRLARVPRRRSAPERLRDRRHPPRARAAPRCATSPRGRIRAGRGDQPRRAHPGGGAGARLGAARRAEPRRARHPRGSTVPTAPTSSSPAALVLIDPDAVTVTSPPRSDPPADPRSDRTPGGASARRFTPMRRVRPARGRARVRPVSAPFRFDRIWNFPVPPAELWAVLERTDDYVSWWSWLREFDGRRPARGEPGALHDPVAAAVRAALRRQRACRWSPRRPIVTQIGGDLRGPARLDIAPAGSGSTARLSWSLELGNPVLAPARPLRPAGDGVGPRRRGGARRRAVPPSGPRRRSGRRPRVVTPPSAF